MSVKLLNEGAFKKWIQDELKQHWRQTLQDSAHNIYYKVRDLIIKEIEQSQTYKSLIGGQLTGEFGLENPQDKVNQILEKWKQSISVKINGQIFELLMIPADYADVLKLSGAEQEITHYEDHQLVRTGMYMHWLDWLLKQGDTTIVRTYHVSVNPRFLTSSRTGRAVMLKKGKWSVPPQFAGIADNNWVTRVVDSQLTTIADLMQGEVERNW